MSSQPHISQGKTALKHLCHAARDALSPVRSPNFSCVSSQEST
jgi:hypothetical protein